MWIMKKIIRIWINNSYDNLSWKDCWASFEGEWIFSCKGYELGYAVAMFYTFFIQLIKLLLVQSTNWYRHLMIKFINVYIYIYI